MKPTIEQIASKFGASPEQVEAQIRKNRTQLWGMYQKARETGLLINGYEAHELLDAISRIPAGDFEEINNRIKFAVDNTNEQRARTNALKAIRWIITNEAGEALQPIVTLAAKPTFGDVKTAEVFDGRDSQSMKLAVLMAITQRQLFLMLCEF